jgi:hypothetical protein
VTDQPTSKNEQPLPEQARPDSSHPSSSATQSRSPVPSSTLEDAKRIAHVAKSDDRFKKTGTAKFNAPSQPSQPTRATPQVEEPKDTGSACSTSGKDAGAKPNHGSGGGCCAP